MQRSRTTLFLLGSLAATAAVACGEIDASKSAQSATDARSEDAATERADAGGGDSTASPPLDPACAVVAGCYEIVESGATISSSSGANQGDGICSPRWSESRYGTLPFTDPREPADAWCAQRKPGSPPVPMPTAPDCALSVRCEDGRPSNFSAHAEVDVDPDGVTMVLSYGHDGPGAGCRFTTVATKVDDALCADAGK